MILKSFSVAGYSTWHYYKPLKILFDAGELCALHLKGGAGIEKIFLSHGHTDHINGLATLIWYRLLEKNPMPLSIYYLNEEIEVINYIEFLVNQYSLKNSAIIKFVPIGFDQEIIFENNAKYMVKAFKVEHEPGVFKLGFNLIEKRKKLNAQFFEAAPETIKKAVNNGTEVYSDYFIKLLTYTGDCCKVNTDYLMDTEYLIIDCTYIQPGEKYMHCHLNLDDVFKIASLVNPKKVILSHISLKYGKNEIIECVNKITENSPGFKIIFPGEIFEI